MKTVLMLRQRAVGGDRFARENERIPFKHVKLEMCVRHPHRDTKQADGSVNLELRAGSV